ncbi:ArsR family transcriptional regulator [Candidatus Woesearchaeota archaeon]|nr:ArsR family transcriptional regulator [Candidatus Woesearchaeota archaeon]
MATGSVKRNGSTSINFNGNGKRTFKEIRKDILKSLSNGQETINHISNETDINWKTVENHLIYLIGRGLVSEVFSSDYVRIFELTEEGKDYVLSEFPQKRVLDNKLINNRMMISKKARL